LPNSSPHASARYQEECRQNYQWFPILGPQSLAFRSPADELFFGGKAGAGKSDLLIGLGLMSHRKSLFLRREATQLQEVASRVQELIRPGDRWRGSGYGGLLTTAHGRTIEFGGCEHEKDKQKFKGRAHDLKAFDEVVDFTKSQYEFIIGWNRTTVPGQRCRIVCASNPPTTAEGDWVIQRWRAWLDPSAGNRAGPGELRWYTTVGEKEEELADNAPITFKGKTYHPRSRSFIPGDMLELLIATGYHNTLATLPEPLRSIYLEGDFGASKQDAAWQLIPTRWVEMANDRWAKRYENRGELRALGADPSRGGNDKATIAPRYGAKKPEDGAVIGPLLTMPGKSILEGKDMLPLIKNAGGGVKGIPTNVDAIGIGSSVVDSAKLLGMSDVIAIIVSNAAHWRDPKSPLLKFRNQRAALMWKVRTLLDPERGPPETRLALPPDPELKADLTAPTYEAGVGGVLVESKDDIKERIGRSTDKGDAVGLACWEKPEVHLSFANT
jgi:hypothetical protein